MPNLSVAHQDGDRFELQVRGHRLLILQPHLPFTSLVVCASRSGLMAVGASVTRSAPGSAGPALSTPGPPVSGGPRAR